MEPFSRDTPGVDAFFFIKANAEFAVLDLFARLPVKVLIAIFKDVRSPDIKLYRRVVVAAMWSPSNLLTEIITLVIEVEHLRVVDKEGERSTH